jgi:hypothetical protein
LRRVSRGVERSEGVNKVWVTLEGLKRLRKCLRKPRGVWENSQEPKGRERAWWSVARCKEAFESLRKSSKAQRGWKGLKSPKRFQN